MGYPSASEIRRFCDWIARGDCFAGDISEILSALLVKVDHPGMLLYWVSEIAKRKAVHNGGEWDQVAKEVQAAADRVARLSARV